MITCECGGAFDTTQTAAQHRCGFKFGVSYRLLFIDDQPVILCLRCRLISIMRSDLEKRRCGKCNKAHTFTREEADVNG